MPVNDFGEIKLMQISDAEFIQVRDLVHDRFGIFLTEQKKTLVVARLQKIIQNKGLTSIADYINFIKKDGGETHLIELVNQITTNHTFFYRENEHFNYFAQKVLPYFKEKKAKEKEIRIWSAGCSSGEEPYTLIMLMMEYFGMEYTHWNAGVLATDISDRVIQLAKAAVYPKDKTTELPSAWQQKYLEKVDEENVRVIDKIKKEVTFRHLNLMNEHFPFKKPFDAIFCRNVMIYFDAKTRKELVQRYFENLVPGGYLFIGHSESIPRDETQFQYIMPAVYRRPL